MQVLDTCGDTPFAEHEIKSAVMDGLDGRRLMQSMIVKLAGGMTDRVTEGSGTAVSAAAVFSVCSATAATSCPSPAANCRAACDFDSRSSLTRSRSLAVAKLGDALATGIMIREAQATDTMEGTLCGSR